MFKRVVFYFYLVLIGTGCVAGGMAADEPGNVSVLLRDGTAALEDQLSV